MPPGCAIKPPTFCHRSCFSIARISGLLTVIQESDVGHVVYTSEGRGLFGGHRIFSGMSFIVSDSNKNRGPSRGK